MLYCHFQRGPELFLLYVRLFPSPTEFKCLIMLLYPSLLRLAMGCGTKSWVSKVTAGREKSGHSSWPCHHLPLHPHPSQPKGLTGLAGDYAQQGSQLFLVLLGVYSVGCWKRTPPVHDWLRRIHS